MPGIKPGAAGREASMLPLSKQTFFKGCHHRGGSFIYWAHVTSLRCKANVQSINTFRTLIDIVFTNHKRKVHFNRDSTAKSPCWLRVSNLWPSDPEQTNFVPGDRPFNDSVQRGQQRFRDSNLRPRLLPSTLPEHVDQVPLGRLHGKQNVVNVADDVRVNGIDQLGRLRHRQKRVDPSLRVQRQLPGRDLPFRRSSLPVRWRDAQERLEVQPADAAGGLAVPPDHPVEHPGRLRQRRRSRSDGASDQRPGFVDHWWRYVRDQIY